MMIAKINSSAVIGINAHPVTIEVSVSKGIGYQITGLADDSIRESLARIAIALENVGYHMPRTKLLVHMSPANIRKSGSAFDLSIALGILLATGQINDMGKLDHYSIAGELSLDGSVKRINGALARSELAMREKLSGLLIPRDNAAEAALIPNARVYPVDHLRQVIRFISADIAMDPFVSGPLFTDPLTTGHDFKNVTGQENIKRALEIAAAGGHHTLISGYPGTGKTMSVKCLPSILPPMTDNEIVETTKIHSLHSSRIQQLITHRPFREIHHTISATGLVGGGAQAAPGEITYAHNGVLFMDEFTECKTSVLEALRQPLEEKKVNVARAGITVEYPAAFMLVAAMNRCACGYFGHPMKKCTCSPRALWWHRRKLSGPILDRFDLCATTEISEAHEIFNPPEGNENSAAIRRRVINARRIQLKRLNRYPNITCNAQLPHDLVQQYCSLDDYARKFLHRSWECLRFSHRGLDKILKVARTIADLHGNEYIELPDIAEAIHYKSIDPSNKLIKRRKQHE